jgi:hypothetical protein
MRLSLESRSHSKIYRCTASQESRPSHHIRHIRPSAVAFHAALPSTNAESGSDVSPREINFGPMSLLHMHGPRLHLSICRTLFARSNEFELVIREDSSHKPRDWLKSMDIFTPVIETSRNATTLEPRISDTPSLPPPTRNNFVVPSS